MLLSPVIHGRVEGGKFVANDTNLFRTAFFCHEGKAVELQVKRYKKARSLNQNAYYHGVIVPMIGNAIGEDDFEEVHAMLKSEFNYEILVIGDAEIKKPLSTAKLSTSDFETYLEKVRCWAAQFLSLYLPLPNEVTT